MARPDIVDWAQSEAGFYLADGPLKDRPTVLPPEHVRLLRYLFPNDVEKFPHDDIMWSDSKKSFKTTTMALLHVYFALFVDTPGEQFVLSNDKQGAKDRIFKAIWDCCLRNPLLRGRCFRESDYIRVPCGETAQGDTIYSVIRMLPIDYAGDAGTNHTLVTVDEPWGIEHDDHMRLMDEVAVPVIRRTNSVVVFTGYAGWQGKSVYWEEKYQRFFDEHDKPLHPQAPIDLPAWIDGETFCYWNRDPTRWYTEQELEGQRKKRRENAYRRQLLNEWVPDEDVFIDIRFWDACYSDRLAPVVVAPDEDEQYEREHLVLGVDAAPKHDYAALSARTWRNDRDKIQLRYDEVWKPRLIGDEVVVDLLDLKRRILQLHDTHHVLAVGYDPYQMASIAQELRRNGVNMVEVPQTDRRIEIDELYYELIHSGKLEHYAAPMLREHVRHAVARESQRGFRLDKRKTTRKIDAAVADAMACWLVVQNKARFQALERQAKQPKTAPRPGFSQIYRRGVGYGPTVRTHVR